MSSAAHAETVAKTRSETGANVQFVAVDLGGVDSVCRMVRSAVDAMGKVTALANAAALTDRGSILNTSPDEWDRMSVHCGQSFVAAYSACKAAMSVTTQPMKQLVKPDHVAGLPCYMLGPRFRGHDSIVGEF